MRGPHFQAKKHPQSHLKPSSFVITRSPNTAAPQVSRGPFLYLKRTNSLVPLMFQQVVVAARQTALGRRSNPSWGIGGSVSDEDYSRSAHSDYAFFFFFYLFFFLLRLFLLPSFIWDCAEPGLSWRWWRAAAGRGRTWSDWRGRAARRRSSGASPSPGVRRRTK